MTVPAVTTYELSVFVHVTSVVIGFGSTFALAVTFPLAMGLDARHIPYVHRLSLAINRWFATPALVVVLLTGLYQTTEGDWDFGSFWISATLAIVIVLGGLIGGVFIPADRRLGALAEREIAAAGDGPVTLSEEYQRGAQRVGIAGALAGFLIVLAIFLMVVKP